jgi:hypothetical protein
MQPTTDGAPGATIAASRPDVVDPDQTGAGMGGEAALRGGGRAYGAAASTANEDQNSPTAILVEGTPEELASLVQSLQQWNIRGGEERLSDYQARGAENSFAINSYAASDAAGGAMAAEPDASPTASTELGPEVREGVLAGRLWIVLRPQGATANPRPSAVNPKSQSQP